MAVRKIKGSWWIDYRVDGKRRRKRSPENTRAGALAFEARAREKVARTGEVDDGNAQLPVKATPAPAFAEFAWEWYESYVLANNKPSEQKNKRTHLRLHLVPNLGCMKLDQITAEHVEKLKAVKRREGLSERTINLILGTLARCLACAHEWGRVQSVPRIRKLKAPTPEMHFLTPKESDQLLAYAKAYAPDWFPVIMTALRTGMRRGELFALHWEDVDLERRKITVRRSMVNGIMSSPKSYRTRYLPMTEELHGCLSGLPGRKGFVFTPYGKPLGWHGAYDHLKRIVKAAGVQPVQWHAFRHTFASQLASAGVPLTVIKELMGHSDIQMTMRYAHFAPSLYDNAVNVLDGLGKEKEENNGHYLGNRPDNALVSGDNALCVLPLNAKQKQTTV